MSFLRRSFQKRFISRNPGYCAQVLAAMGCALLPAGLQGWFHFIDNGIVYYLLWTAVLTALWLRCRLPVQLCMPAVLLALSYSGYVLTQRDDIGYNEISGILNFKADEVVAFVIMPRMFVTLCLVLLVFALLIWLLCGNWLRLRFVMPLRLYTGMLYLVMIGGLFAYFMTGTTWNKQQVYPVNVVSEGYRFISEVQYAKYMHSRMHYTYAGPDASQCPPAMTVVMVIGESARSANWSLYGYERPTTPLVADRLEKSDNRGVVFLDALAAGRLTMNAVPSMLSPTCAKDFQNYCTTPSVIRVFRSAGYRTGVISSQIRASEFWDGAVNLMLNDSASIERLDHDDHMPAALDRWLGGDPQARQFAVLHLFGSHYNYSERYPDRFNRFRGGDEMIDTYDNSLAFTDDVLARLIDRIQKIPTPAVLFYSSDHGENLNDFGDGNIQHSCREFTRYEIEVPMLFFANHAFATAHPQQLAAIRACAMRPVSHDNISQTLIGIAGLTDPHIYLPQCDLSNQLFSPQPRFLIKNLWEVVAESAVRATPHGRKPAP
ncbi:MAG: phosphoethanolamine transferase [Verrucomicrobiota bacterium]